MPFQYSPQGQLNPIFPAAAQIGIDNQRGGDPMMAVLNYNARMRQQQAQQDFQQSQLKLAHEQMMAKAQGGTTPSQTAPAKRQSPGMTDSIQSAKHAARSLLLGDADLNDDQTKQLDDLEANPNFSYQDYTHLIGTAAGQVQKKSQQQASADKTQQQQQNFQTREQDTQQHQQQTMLQQKARASLSDLEKQLSVVRKQKEGLDYGLPMKPNRKNYPAWKSLDDREQALTKQRDQIAGQLQGGDQGQQQPQEQGQQVTPDIARQLYQQAGGDPNKARELARAQGYQF